ncbi:MAG: Holliday junction resolvase RuvX [Hyphomicrobiales bacterium]|nr:Holliday junction resolvase RuvX [Hyphomicrobiales bacterium]
MALHLTSLETLAATLPAKGRLMGLDLGTKTIGLAISDVERRLASPLLTIRRRKFTLDVEDLKAHISRHDIRALVFGMPLNMDGSSGPRAQATRGFIHNLAPLIDLPVTTWDERLSTAAVTRDLIEQDVSRARRAELVDKLAAAYILQGALDRLACLPQN